MTAVSPSGKYYSRKDLQKLTNPKVKLKKILNNEKSVSERISKLKDERYQRESVPDYFRKHKMKLWGAFRNGCGVYENKFGVFYIIVFDVTTGSKRYELRMSEYLYPKSYKKEDKLFVEMKIKGVALEDDVLYFSYSHNTYAKSSNGQNGYIVSYDLKQNKIIWHTQSLVSNSSNFLVYRDVIVSGYGFTDEKDYLYILNKSNGKVMDKYLVDSKPSYFVKDGASILFRTYKSGYEYVFFRN